MNEKANGWQPIATAPKDGAWVMLTGGNFGLEWDDDFMPPMVVAKYVIWRNGLGANWQFAWYDCGCYGEYENPTLWQLLPAPPVQS